MSATQTDVGTAGKGRGIMLEDICLLIFCLALAVGGLATFIWELVTGRFLNIDGLWLTLISLTLSVVFGGNIAWLVYSGELKGILHLGKEKQEAKDQK